MAFEVASMDSSRARSHRRKKAAMAWCLLGPVGFGAAGAGANAVGLPIWVGGGMILAAIASFLAALVAAIVYAFKETRAAGKLKRWLRDGRLEDLPVIQIVEGTRFGAHRVLRSDAEGFEVGLAGSGIAVLATQAIAIVGGAFLLALWAVCLWQYGAAIAPSAGVRVFLVFWGAPLFAAAAVFWGFRRVVMRWAVGADADGFILETRSLLGGRKLWAVPTGDIDRLRLTLPNLDLVTTGGASYRLVEFEQIDRSHGVADLPAEQANERLNRWRARCVSVAVESVLGLGDDPAVSVAEGAEGEADPADREVPPTTSR
jgi:hypothetical protein